MTIVDGRSATGAAPERVAGEAEVTRPLAPPRRLGRSWAVKGAIAAADLCTIATAMVVAYRTRSVLPGYMPESMAGEHVRLGVLSLPIWAVALVRYRLYAARHVSTAREELIRLLHAVAASVAGIAVMGFALQWYVARGWLVLTFAVALPLLFVERLAVRRILNALRRRGRMLRPVVIVGSNIEALALSSMLTGDPDLGYRVVGFLDDEAQRGATPFRDVPVLGPVTDALDAVRRTGASGVVIASTAVDLVESNALVRTLVDAGVHVELSTTLRDIASERLSVRPVGRFPIMHLAPVQHGGWRAAAKRAFDVVAASIGLAVVTPVAIVAAVAIKLESPGPVLFRQERVGRDGRPFQLLKLRSMVADAEERLVDLRDRNEADGPLFKLADDPRVTAVGRVIRQLSVDELPQLWNVLRGDMSLVGPRPALVTELDGWTPELHQRLRVRPGMTGMWQVNGRSSCTFEDYVRHDLYYVDNWSLGTDLMILARTVPAVLLKRGAC